MRRAVRELLALGPLPSEDEAEVEQLDRYGELLESISPPVSDDEARALVRIFPPSDESCYGLAWTLLHLIETAPHWPLEDCLEDRQSDWVQYLRLRIENARALEQASIEPASDEAEASPGSPGSGSL